MHSELILELLYKEIFDQNWDKTIKNLKGKGTLHLIRPDSEF